MRYNRYETIKDRFPKFVKLKKNSTDKHVEWKEGDRLDLLSYKYYDSVDYFFLILYANPEYLSEWDIPHDTIIRIPYPLERVLDEYENNI